jgi:hypothetical protein
MGNTPLAVVPPRPPRRVGRWLTIFVLAAIAVLLTWRGHGFYGLSLADRPAHPDYAQLKPSGFIGHGYGIVGTALILLNLLYLARRRLVAYLPAWIGSMRVWLNAHAVTGLVGALLVVFHSAFQLRTPIATVTSASLLIVVLTGVIGFYVYALIPKTGGHHLKERLAEIRPMLPGFVINVEALVAKAPITKVPLDASLLRTLVTVPKWVIDARARRRAVKRAAEADKVFRILKFKEPELAKAFVAELTELVAAEVDRHAGSAMIRSWRSLHRFLAILLVVSVSLHIGVAWFYGFRWVLSR